MKILITLGLLICVVVLTCVSKFPFQNHSLADLTQTPPETLVSNAVSTTWHDWHTNWSGCPMLRQEQEGLAKLKKMHKQVGHKDFYHAMTAKQVIDLLGLPERIGEGEHYGPLAMDMEHNVIYPEGVVGTDKIWYYPSEGLFFKVFENECYWEQPLTAECPHRHIGLSI